MDKEDMTDFLELISIMEEYYQPLSPFLREIYWEGLKTFSLSDIKKAFWQHVHSSQDGKFMPKISDFVCYIEDTAETRAMLAWAKIERAMKDVGGYESIVFDDPVIHAVVRHLGGWIKLCQTKTHEIPFVTQQFTKLYPHYERHPETNRSGYLCGMLEHENRILGYDHPEPTVVSITANKKTNGEKSLSCLPAHKSTAFLASDPPKHFDLSARGASDLGSSLSGERLVATVEQEEQEKQEKREDQEKQKRKGAQ